MVINGRTDLANEVRRRLCDGASVTELPGVRAREERIEDFPVTTVEILDERGEKALGKPRGTYITMELPSSPGGLLFRGSAGPRPPDPALRRAAPPRSSLAALAIPISRLTPWALLPPPIFWSRST